MNIVSKLKALVFIIVVGLASKTFPGNTAEQQETRASHAAHAVKSLICATPTAAATYALINLILQRPAPAKNGLLALSAVITGLATGKLAWNTLASIWHATFDEQTAQRTSTSIEYWTAGLATLSPFIVWTIYDYRPDIIHAVLD